MKKLSQVVPAEGGRTDLCWQAEVLEALHLTSRTAGWIGLFQRSRCPFCGPQAISHDLELERVLGLPQKHRIIPVICVSTSQGGFLMLLVGPIRPWDSSLPNVECTSVLMCNADITIVSTEPWTV